MSDMPEVKIQIGDVDYDNSFNDDIRIDRTNIDNELSTHAEKYWFYAYLAEEANWRVGVLAHELEQMYARTDHMVRQKAEGIRKAGGNKMTEKMVENEVITDQKYQAKKLDLLDAKKMFGQLKACSMAMMARKDMLVQIGGIARQQMIPDRVMEHKVATAHEVIANNRTAQSMPTAAPTTKPTRRRQPRQ